MHLLHMCIHLHEYLKRFKCKWSTKWQMSRVSRSIMSRSVLLKKLQPSFLGEKRSIPSLLLLNLVQECQGSMPGLTLERWVWVVSWSCWKSAIAQLPLGSPKLISSGHRRGVAQPTMNLADISKELGSRTQQWTNQDSRSWSPQKLSCGSVMFNLKTSAVNRWIGLPWFNMIHLSYLSRNHASILSLNITYLGMRQYAKSHGGTIPP